MSPYRSSRESSHKPRYRPTNRADHSYDDYNKYDHRDSRGHRRDHSRDRNERINDYDNDRDHDHGYNVRKHDNLRGRENNRENNRESRRYHHRRERSRSPTQHRSQYRERAEEVNHSRPPRKYQSTDRRASSEDAHRDASKIVFMKGLPRDLEEKDIIIQLQGIRGFFSSVKVKIDRFANSEVDCTLSFSNVDDASTFAKNREIRIYAKQDTRREYPTIVRLEQQEWICRVCRQENYGHRTLCRNENNHPAENPNSEPTDINGDKDCGDTLSQFLVIQNLKLTTTTERLAKDLEQLCASHNANGARPVSIHKIFLATVPATQQSRGYAIVEFFAPEDATATLNKYIQSGSVMIDSQKVKLSRTHEGIFWRVDTPLPHLNARGFPRFMNRQGIEMAYHDIEVELKEHVVSSLPPQPTMEQPTASNMPKKKATKPKAPKQSTLKPLPLVVTRWTASHEDINKAGMVEKHQVTDSNAVANSLDIDPTSPPSSPSLDFENFLDLIELKCYLCNTSFAGRDPGILQKHILKSVKHAELMKVDQEKQNAKGRMQNISRARKKKGGRSNTQALAYQDRAEQRRARDGLARTTTSNNRSSPPPTASVSYGERMVRNLGWTPNVGLGANGTGITTAITPSMHVNRAGLGSHGSNLGSAITFASDNTTGRDTFSQRTAESARQRFHVLQDQPPNPDVDY